MSEAVLYPIQLVAPCTNADSPIEPYDPCDTTSTSPLTDLDVILVWVQRPGQIDSTLVQTIPARGMECSTLFGNPDLAPGHTYRLWCQPKDLSGNLSKCRGPELNVAIPAITGIEPNPIDYPVNPDDRVVVTKYYGLRGPTAWPPKVSGIYWKVDIYQSGRKIRHQIRYVK